MIQDSIIHPEEEKHKQTKNDNNSKTNNNKQQHTHTHTHRICPYCYMPKRTIRTQVSDGDTAECDHRFVTGLLNNLLLHALVLP